MRTLDLGLLRRLPEEAQPLMRFVCTHMVHSYKPVLAGIFLRGLPRSEFPLDEVAAEFVAFYRDRAERGLGVERLHCPFVSEHGLLEDRAARVGAKILYDVFRRGQGCIALGKETVPRLVES